MTNNYDFSLFQKRASEAREWLEKEVGALRTGRANPALVENLNIDYYGEKTPLKHIAALNVVDARTLRIQPWDKEALPIIETTIRLSNLGVEPVLEKDTLRLVLPELTQERRESILKVLKEKTEEAKISLRQARDDVWRNIQGKERSGEITEDDKFRFKEELQKELEDGYKTLEKIEEKKEREIKQ